MTIAIPYTATLAEDETLSLTVEVSQSEDNSTFDTAVVVYAKTVVATGGSGGSTETGVLTVDLSINGYKRYFKIGTTADLSAANTDTAEVMTMTILSGADTLPAV